MRRLIPPYLSSSFLLGWLFLSACSHVPSQAPEQAPVKQVVLESSQIFHHYSAINNHQYQLRVSFPASYQSNLSKRYPVVIKLDGQWDFLLAASAYNCVYFDGQMPETLFVGIDWGDVEGDIHAIRSRDLMPTPVEVYENSGHAKQFVDVLVEEIIPELETRFRLNDQRFLMGTSMSALFSTYALLERPEAFDGAISIAADYESSNDELMRLVESLEGTNKLADKRLYLGVGSWDLVAPSVLSFAERLQASKLPGFQLLLEQAPGYGHSGMNIPGYGGGYRFLFERENLAMPNGVERYLGRYHANDNSGDWLVIRLTEQGLEAENNAGQTLLLRAKSENTFYHPGVFFKLRFDGEQLLLETFFGDRQYQKDS